MQLRHYFALVLVTVLVAACSGRTVVSPPGGGYYGGDAPPQTQRDISNIGDAVPRYEPLSRYGNNPYEALGNRYVPMKSAQGFSQTGMASWYGKKFHGRRTSSGETYDMWAMTAAHPVLPLPTYVRVTNLDNGRVVVVKVNDRGPFLHDRIIDLSFAAAQKLDIASRGTGRVSIEAIVVPADGSTYEAAGNLPVGGNFLVQVGAFSSLERARNLRQALLESGYSVYPEAVDVLAARGQPYRVQVGPYSGAGEAAEVRSRLLGSYPGAIVVSLE